MKRVKYATAFATFLIVACCLCACTRELEIGTTSLPDGMVGVAYEAIISTEGDFVDCVWTVQGAGLPPGLSLIGRSERGVIRGTPTQPGLFMFKIEVTDRSGRFTDSRDFEIRIVPDPYPVLAITTTTLPYGTSAVPYTAQIDASGGSGLGYQWSIVSQALPPGLSLQQTGTPSTSISGVPAAGGNYNFTIRVRDSVGHIALAALQIQVDAVLTITTTTLPRGMENRTYNEVISAAGGTGIGYSWSVVAGTIPPGMNLAPNGTPSTLLDGIPTAPQVYTFTLEVTDSLAHVAQTFMQLEVLPDLVITTSSLPDAQLSVSYTEPINATGGAAGGYDWVLDSGTLPPGLVLAPGPAVGSSLSGTPNTIGQYTFTVRATDQFGFSAWQAYSVDVAQDLTILTTSIGPATYGVAFSDSITATGGTFAGYTWSVFSGTLPPGLSLGSIGTPGTTVAGIPSQIGVFNFTILVQDSNGETETRPYSVIVQGGTSLAISTSFLPAAHTGQAYSVAVSASGGTNGGYTWTVVVGSLHSDFSLAFAGSPSTSISGNPGSTFSSCTFTLQVQDAAAATATRTFTLSVFDAVQITTTSLPPGDTSQAYSQPINATGGDVPNYAWSISQGALPAGLALSASGAPGALSGTPTEIGTFSFVIQLNDGTGSSDTQAFSLLIYGPGFIDTVAGNGTQQFTDGADVLQTGLKFPTGISFAANGDLYFCSLDDHSVFRILASTNQVFRIAGDGNQGSSGDGFDASIARFHSPHDVLVDSTGNVYIADTYNDRIRVINSSTNIITTFAGGGASSGVGDGLPANQARLSEPFGLSWAQNGDMLIADHGHCRIRRINMTTTIVSTVAGTGSAWSGDGPVASTAIGNVAEVAQAANGDFYFSDFNSHAIRRIVAATQMVQTLAGTGGAGMASPGGQANTASVGRPYGIILDSNGDVLFAEERNHRIMRIEMSSGTLQVVAGTGQDAGMAGSYSGDGGPAVNATLNVPAHILFGPDGHLYFADRGNCVVRRVRQ